MVKHVSVGVYKYRYCHFVAYFLKQGMNHIYECSTRLAPGENEKRCVLVNAQITFAENAACEIGEHLPNIMVANSIADKCHVALTSVHFIWCLSMLYSRDGNSILQLGLELCLSGKKCLET